MGTSSVSSRGPLARYQNTSVIVNASGTEMEINSEGRAGVVQHAHPGNGFIHFETPDISADQDFIVIDLSDTTNYPHSETEYIHLEWMRVHVETTDANYLVQVGYLNDVDATNGDFYGLLDVPGNKELGRPQDKEFSFYPNGPRCRLASVLSSEKSLNDTAFQTDVNLASTLDPSTADTPSGTGDLVIRVSITAGSLIAGIELSYHAHS